MSNRIYNSDDVADYSLQPTISSIIDVLSGDFFEVYAITDEYTEAKRNISGDSRQTFFYGYKLSKSESSSTSYTNSIVANSSVSVAGYQNSTFNITGSDIDIASGSNITVKTSNLTTDRSINYVTGTAIDSILVSGSGNISYIDLKNGDMSFTGVSGSTNVISGANTVNATGISYFIYNSTVTIGG